MKKLWTSVVLQAVDDIQHRPMQTVDYAEAVAFFTRSGTWAESRTIVSDFLGMHPDELKAIGERCITARTAGIRG